MPAISVPHAFATRFAAVLSALAALTACNLVSPPAPAPAPAPPANVTVVTPPAETKTVYEIKSGRYEEVNPATPTTKTTVYFDDYGAKTATYTVTDSGGKKTTTVAINNNDGYVTTYVVGGKTATRMKFVASAAPAVVTIPEGERKPLGVVEVAGVKCEGWEVTSASGGTKVWTYKGIPCKVETGENVVLQTTVIKEEAPTVEFTVPAEIVVSPE